ncbi:hypothetical protein V8E52_010953 [Russula decolorans]
MREIVTCSSTGRHHNPSASVTGWADPSKRDSPAFPQDSQGSEESDPNQGSDRETPQNESFEPPSEGASPTSLGENLERPSYQCTRCPELKPFAQKSSLTRHCREQHELCFKCSQDPDNCVYTWSGSRKSEFKQHLSKRHKLDDHKIVEILKMPPILCPPRDRVIESALSPPELTTTENEDSPGDLEQCAAIHAPRVLSEENFALLCGYHKVHRRFPFP